MLRAIVVLASLLSVAAFAPMGRTAQRSAISMDVQDMCGIPEGKGEGGFFDPLGLSVGKDDATINWYRAAELKHGRVSMLATVGVIVQGLDTKIIRGFPVTETNEFSALSKVYYENPSALIQIILSIAA
ncbi:hypothetical protein B484DRAFT_403785, partial [Ochromonadaceae sp. CCMP2298]